MNVENPHRTRHTCAECLNTAACWVCEGRGSVGDRIGSRPCATCSGRGMCRACRPLPAQRSPEGEQLPA